jgi:hypothetical protein
VASGRVLDGPAFYLVSISALTALVFPALYPRLIQGDTWAATALAARNALLAVFIARLSWQRSWLGIGDSCASNMAKRADHEGASDSV